MSVVLTAGACRSPEAEQKPSPSAQAPLRAGFHVGDERRYQVQLESEASVQGEPITQFGLSGVWTLNTVEQSAQGVVLFAKLDNARLTSKYPQLSGPMAALAPALEKPFGIELDAAGAIKALVFLEPPSALVVGIRQTLAQALQASRNSATTWTAEERDATGRYQAEYQKQPDGSLVRRKLAYSTINATISASVPTADLLPKVDRAQARLRIDQGGALESLESSERLLSGSGQIAPIDSATTLSLVLAAPAARANSDAAGLAARLRGGQRLAADSVWTPEVKDEQFDAARIGNYTLERVLKELRGLVASAGPTGTLPEKQRGDLFTALSAMIRHQPESRREVIAMIKRNDPLTETLLDALGASGDADAQAALSEFLAKSQDTKRQRIAAIALSHTKSPTPEATAALVKLLDVEGQRIQALYGLGTHISTLLAAHDEQRAQEILAIVLNRLRTAPDSLQRITALRAVANAGHKDAFPAVLPFLKDKDEQVRAAAVESLQSIPLPAADAIIAKALGGDAVTGVRQAAARAALLRTPTPELVAAAKSAAQSDKSPHVRLAAVSVLERYSATQSAILSVLKDVAEKDAEEAIRKEAKRIVAASEQGLLRAPG